MHAALGAPVLPAEPLLAWADDNLRDLPWRRTRDPWLVLVSELMLQQTQVARVVPKYMAFIARFPDPASCAAVPVGEVVTAWAGLGYNRRAVNLHRAAVAVVERHGGRLPGDLGALLALPGVGAYTGRAVLAFALGRPVCPLDVNTARPIARAARVVTQDGADALVPHDRAWHWTEALMDLGALICTRRAPRCAECPWHTCCQWRQAGHPEPDPAVPAARQSPFAGSDRQGRGRIVDALRLGSLAADAVPDVAGWPTDAPRAERVATTLVADGLAVRTPDGGLALP